MFRLETIGWKAWYESGKTFTSKTHQWNNIPREGLVILKKFYNIFDIQGRKLRDEETEEDVFSELVYGHSMLCLSIENIMKYQKLPRCIKFPQQLTEEEMKPFIETAQQDKEFSCQQMSMPLSTGKSAS